MCGWPQFQGKQSHSKENPKPSKFSTSQQKELEEGAQFTLSYLQSNGLGSNSPFLFVHKVSSMIMSFPNRHQHPMPILGKCSSEQETKEQRKKSWVRKDSSPLFFNFVIPTLERFLSSEPVQDSRHNKHLNSVAG